MFVLAICSNTADGIGVSGDVFMERLGVGSRRKIEFHHSIECRATCRKPLATVRERAAQLTAVETTVTSDDPDTYAATRLVLRNAADGTTSACAFRGACRGFCTTHSTSFFAHGCNS